MNFMDVFVMVVCTVYVYECHGCFCHGRVLYEFHGCFWHGRVDSI